MLTIILMILEGIAMVCLALFCGSRWYYRTKRERLEKEESQKKSKVLVSSDGIDWNEALP